MKILYFSQFYEPENIAAAFRAADHARYWAQAGHDVTVFTSWPNYPTGELFDGYSMVPLEKSVVDGVRILRSQSIIQPNASFKKRNESGVSLILNGLKNLNCDAVAGEDYDIVLSTCGTVFSAWLGVHYAAKRKIPLVVEFRDLTYRQMIATGSSENSFKTKAMKSLELSFCKAANRVVVLTEGFKDSLVEEGVPASILSVVPNGADIVPCEHSWHHPLRLGYFGTMGLSQDVPATVELASELEKRDLLSEYLLIGEGAARSELEETVHSGAFGFVRLMHGISQKELEKYYAGVDMTVVSLRKDDSFAGTIPSKIFQSFARGVPVLFIGPEGEAARLVRDSGAGIALCGDRKEDLAALCDFAGSPDLHEQLETMSESAIDCMEKSYTRKRMAQQMLDVFESLLQERTSSLR